MTRAINPADLIPMDIFVSKCPIQIDLVYASAPHPRNIFKEAIYHSKARLWVHKDLAAIILKVAGTLNDKHGYILELKDCLRTCDAQATMQETEIVKSHPEWCAPGPNRLLSPPGGGAHPRGMAIDVCVLKQDGSETYQELDMGTPFDHMDETSARNYQGFSDEILSNRKLLENTFIESAKELNLPILPIPPEWWDFRFPPDYTSQYTPLKDSDLPPQMQMTNKIANNIPDFDNAHFEALANEILARVNN